MALKLEEKRMTGLIDGEFYYSLTYKDVLDILKIIDNCNFQEFNLKVGELRLAIKKGKDDNEVSEVVNVENNNSEVVTSNVNEMKDILSPVVTFQQAAVPAMEGVVIKAPITGVFYKAPAPGAEPFVKVGSKVKKGDQLGIIEVMKVMNAIRATCDGVVKEILVENEQMVEFDQVLMIIDPLE